MALHMLPAVIAALLHMYYRDAMGVQLLECLIAVTDARALHDHRATVQALADMVGVHETRLDVLMIHDQQPLLGAAFKQLFAFDREEVHAVMV